MKHLLVILTCLLVTRHGESAQLFMSQDGVNIRTIHRWDNSYGLVLQGSTMGPLLETATSTSYPFSFSQSCQGLAYSAKGAFQRPFHRLDHLCPDEGGGDELSFLFISDTQALNSAHRKVGEFISKLLEEGAYSFVVNGGDIVNFGTETQWRKYYNISSQYLQKTPVVPVLGNHEFYNDKQVRYYQEVYGSGDAPAYFSFKLKNNLFISLDSNQDSRDDDYMERQLHWLEAQLQDHAATHNVIVAYHHPAYSSGLSQVAMPHVPRYIQTYWLPLFEKYGVDLILNGHDHIYERLEYGNGIPAIISGAAGGFLGLRGLKHKYSKAIHLGKRTVTSIKISGDRIYIEALNAYDGKVLDTVNYPVR